jgi:membrane protein
VLALGLTASVMSSSFVSQMAAIEPVGAMIYVLGRLIPYFVIVALFTFLYAFIPNTRVRLGPAFGGGLLAGFLWQSASLAFASFVANSPNYNAIYSGFAIVILLLFWLYIGWLVLLIGCQLAYYLQNPERLTPTRIPPQLWGRAAELLGLQAVALVGRRFLAGEPPVTLDQLQRELPAVPDHVERVVEVLLHHGVLAESGTDNRQLLPKRDLDSLTVAQVWQMMRDGVDGRRGANSESLALVESVEKDFAQGVGGNTVREWLTQQKETQ